MSASVQQVLAAALALSAAEQEWLVTEVISSLDGPPPPPEEMARIEVAWMEEVRRRMDAIDRGEAELIDAELVFAELGVKFPPDGRATREEPVASEVSRVLPDSALTLPERGRAELGHLLLRHLDGDDSATGA